MPEALKDDDNDGRYIFENFKEFVAILNNNSLLSSRLAIDVGVQRGQIVNNS